jgi:hypothetical protein
MVRLFAIAALLTDLSVHCLLAQTPSGATDNELYAAYCKGVLDHEIEQLKPGEKPSVENAERELKKTRQDQINSGDFIPHSSPEELRQRAQEAQAAKERTWENLQAMQVESQNERKRFAAYLLATGVLTDPERTGASLGITVAMSQGRQDSKQCLATMSRCIDTNDTEKTLSEQQKNLETCVNTDPSCAKIWRCHKPDSLPF